MPKAAAQGSAPRRASRLAFLTAMGSECFGRKPGYCLFINYPNIVFLQYVSSTRDRRRVRDMFQ